MAEDYYKRAKQISWRYSRTNKRNYLSGKQYAYTMYHRDIGSTRQKELRLITLKQYKWLKRNNYKPFTYKDLYIYVGARTKNEELFVRGYFNWLANRFGRV